MKEELGQAVPEIVGDHRSAEEILDQLVTQLANGQNTYELEVPVDDSQEIIGLEVEAWADGSGTLLTFQIEKKTGSKVEYHGIVKMNYEKPKLDGVRGMWTEGEGPFSLDAPEQHEFFKKHTLPRWLRQLVPLA